MSKKRLRRGLWRGAVASDGTTAGEGGGARNSGRLGTMYSLKYLCESFLKQWCRGERKKETSGSMGMLRPPRDETTLVLAPSQCMVILCIEKMALPSGANATSSGRAARPRSAAKSAAVQSSQRSTKSVSFLSLSQPSCHDVEPRSCVATKARHDCSHGDGVYTRRGSHDREECDAIPTRPSEDHFQMVATPAEKNTPGYKRPTKP